MRFLNTILLLWLSAAFAVTGHAGFVTGRPAPPEEPPIKPRIGRRYPADGDTDRIDDRLTWRRDDAHVRLGKAATPGGKKAVERELAEPVDVELIFDKQITQKQIDAFLAAGGEITYVYTDVSYGWHGRVALEVVPKLPTRMGDSLVLVEQPSKVIAHLDRATGTGRVRPLWVNGFAGTTGLDGDATITIGIIDSGIDATHPDLSGRQVYWHDFTSEGLASPADIDQHGTHVAGIALGTGSAGGIAAGTLEYTSVGDLTDVGGFFPNPVDGLSGSVNFQATAKWTGGGSTTLYLLYQTKPSGGWSYFDSTSGTTSLSLSKTATAYTSRAYTPGLLGQEDSSVADFVVTSRISNYPAVGDGFAKFRGVAPACRWAAARVLDNTGSGYSSWMGQAVDALVANRVAHNTKVINLSLGINGDPGTSTTFRQKVNSAVLNGIVACVSAGNDGREATDGARQVDDPGRAAMALTVAAANDVNELTEYTSHGFASPGSTAGREEDYKPDLMAPGGSVGAYTGIMAPDSNSGDGTAFMDQQADDYYNIQGTSMSSPFAAGCAALVIDAMQQFGITWDFTSGTHSRYVKMLLCATATESNANREDGNYNPTLQRAAAGPDGFPAGKDKYEGFGMINPDAAIEAVLLYHTPGDTENATLGAAAEDRRAWARTVTLSAGQTFDPELTVPATGDFDLYLYSATPATYGTPVLLVSSTTAGTGPDESLSYTTGADQDVVLVVKRVSGSGSFSLTSTGVTPRSLTITSPRGMADPAVGVHSYTHGTEVTCAVTNSPHTIHEATRSSMVVCTGWVGTGSAPVLGSTTDTGAFSLTEDSSVTWLWAVSNLWVSNQTITAAVTEEALDTVTAGDDYVVDPGGDATFSAGREVRLKPGFESRNGSDFRARIDP